MSRLPCDTHKAIHPVLWARNDWPYQGVCLSLSGAKRQTPNWALHNKYKNPSFTHPTGRCIMGNYCDFIHFQRFIVLLGSLAGLFGSPNEISEDNSSQCGGRRDCSMDSLVRELEKFLRIHKFHCPSVTVLFQDTFPEIICNW